MKCETCGVDTGMYPLSDKPDPGWGYKTHTWEQCARQLLGEVVGVVPERSRGEGDLNERINRLLVKPDSRWKHVKEAIGILEHVRSEGDR